MSKPKGQIRSLNVNRYLLHRQSLMVDKVEDLEAMMKSLLLNKIHGLSFSPYLEGQDPSDKIIITPKQISERLDVIAPYTNWVRIFSSTFGNDLVPRIAKEKGLKTMVGAWLSDDLEQNEIELANVIEIARAGHADLLAIGNEVLLRDELEIEQLVAYIQRVKDAVPGVPVGYVDAYYMYVNHPELVDVCDVLFANLYPFWEYVALEISIDYMSKMYEFVRVNANGKPIVISETGWPSKGEQYGGAQPSYENAMRYFIQAQQWAKQHQIPMFYFSSFDEVWKINHEGEYGAYWGIWDKDGNYKYNKHNK